MARQWFTIGDDFEAAARRAVAEEAGELARMEIGRAVARHDYEVTAERPASIQQAEVVEDLHRELAARLALIQSQHEALALIQEQGEVIADLHRELAARLALIESQHEQGEVIKDLHRELTARLTLIQSQQRALGEARTVLMLLRTSWVYRVMRALGQWGWLEHRIRRVLQ